ncbi:FAD-binding PCMH-type domain-containing protein [Fusarium sp. Ph1]|nr:FAD-binding PCMH-type domain-containing protein [Fusarium sp. Ph1]
MCSLRFILFKEHQVQFAIRGGGAMPVDNAGNIGPEGIMMATTNLRAWPSQTTARPSVSRLTVLRSGNGGVVGAVLGDEALRLHGLWVGMSNIAASLDCVLADGTLVTASADEHQDLFWALVGGGNNYCVVTEATLHTIPISSALIGTVSWGWRGDVPLGLENFTAPILPITRGNITRTTMGQWSNGFNYAPPLGTRAIFHWLTSAANATAARIAFDTYYESIASLADVEGFSNHFQHAPNHTIVTSALPPANAMGLGSTTTARRSGHVESPLWSNPEDDERVLRCTAEANAKIREKLSAAGPWTLSHLCTLGDIQISDP